MKNENNELKDKRIYTMAKETPYKAVLKMGIPVTMGMLFMVVYNLVDTYFIGMLHDSYQLAATNFAYPVMMIMVAIAGIVGNGGSSYIARCLGAQKIGLANHTLTLGIELVVISSIVISTAGLLFLDSIVNLLGVGENTFLFTRKYVSVILAGSFFTMGNYAFGQLLRSEGSTVYSMVGMIVGTVANIILDPVFIFLFHMGITGAAIATVLGNALSVVIFLSYYMKKKALLRPEKRYLKFDGTILKEIMLVGIPHTLEQFLMTAAMIVNNNLAVQYGELTVAAMGVSNKIMSFGNYIYQGMAAGSQPLMGYNYGAKNFARMKQLMKSGIITISIAELGIMMIYGFFAPQLIGCFSNSDDVINIGAKTLRAAMLMLPFVGATSISRNTFNACGKPAYAFGITAVRQLVLYIPMLISFNYLWGYTGLIYARPLEELICMIFAVGLLLYQFKKFGKEEI